MAWEDQKADLLSIFEAAVARVRPYEMLLSQLKLNGSTLSVTTETVHETVDLKRFDQIVVLGAGKAAAPMARAIESVLGDRISGGVISVKEGHTEPLKHIEIIEAGHPVPNEQSVLAGRRISELAAQATERTLFITLISGGGSALLAAPRRAVVDGLTVALTLEEIQETTDTLLTCGATITEMNTIRKHLSEIKGGLLASAMAPAHAICLILSDVVGDSLHSIASGITVGDPTTFADALAVVDGYRIRDRLPAAVVQILSAGAAGQIPDTPRPGSTVFSKVRNFLAGTNHQALQAAADQAARLGYAPLVVTSHLTGEARVAAQLVLAVARDVLKHDSPVRVPACLLFGGETTVTIRGSGVGGRNQELALACLKQMAELEEPLADVAMLSGATDGTDGPTSAAGGFAAPALVGKARQMGLSIDAYLDNNDSYHFFRVLDELLITGPTLTNVCDLQVMLIGRPTPGS